MVLHRVLHGVGLRVLSSPGQPSWPVLTNGKCLWLSLFLRDSCMCMHQAYKRCTENLSIINISMSYLNQYCKNIQEHRQRDKSVFFCSLDSCNQQDKPCTQLIVLLHMLLQKQIELIKSNLHWLRPSYDLKLIKYDYQQCTHITKLVTPHILYQTQYCNNGGSSS